MLLASISIVCWLVAYAALCMAQPFRPCGKCGGHGHLEVSGKLKTCRRCHGKGQRLRYGRRAWNAWRRTYDNGAR